jgi:polysaccharide chain length determinant protein (PEP-CTERM system associated)
MIANRELGIEDYLAIGRRRLLLVLIPALIAALIGLAISFAFRPRYTSRSLVQVQAQIVPTGYVKPIITAPVSDRIATVQQNVLSRDRLRPLVTRLDLARGGKTVDQAITEIRSNLAVAEADPRVKFSGSPGRQPGDTSDISGFYVFFTADNPRDAQQVCAEITSMLLEENLELRQEVARSTTAFLALQLEQAKNHLDELDSKFSEFKIKHLGRLPGDLGSNLQILTALESQLDASTQTLGRVLQDKSYAETLLSQELAAWKASLASPTLPPLRQELINLKSHLVVLQSRYSEDHPDVAKTEHEIAELTKKVDQINSDPDDNPAPENANKKLEPPEIRMLRQQIRHADSIVERTTLGQQRLQARIEQYQSQLAVSPEVEDEYKQLTRDNATAHDIYNSLLADKNSAEMQTEMERKQQGEQLRLLDPATYPGAPSYPVRTTFALYGLGAGLGLGLSVALWLELQDKSIRNEGDVLAAVELPMLGSVPWVGVQKTGKGRRSLLGGRATARMS